jgi:hypothetical protein
VIQVVITNKNEHLKKAITTYMKGFDEIIKTLPKKYRIKNIEIGKPRIVRKGVRLKTGIPVMTPDGEFESITDAAIHHEVTVSCIISRIKKQKEGYSYV